ncbi:MULTISPECIES: beta-glucosidase [Paenibacillus]|uniref:beta-glucosidase n=1 Tax=Paenibacillus TaxID=44249 RepID=UPI0013E936C9|nr:MULTISPECIES: beta-glucosidase [Paenibacillus]KAF6583046.1 glycoside hydrolase family 3 C-terminal domain-containing protein [Paenibacillus sp. EKM211P]UQQ36266.1 glycoside hydrolase family 3 C-terminal domain-containing protein [Paenibacillus polymyxa]
MKVKSTWVFRMVMMTVIAAVVIGPMHIAGAAGSRTDRPWMNTSMSAEKRTALLLQEMTLEEKIDLVTGKVNNYYGFYNNSMERLGIPALKMADGPAGVRIANPDVQDKQSTALPAPIALAATWDTQAAKQYGDLIGDEAFNTTHNVVLGPGMDIARIPWGSRNFESMGEDPLLQSQMVTAYVKGVQSHPVLATAKHYLMNNQETERFTTNVKVSDRALHEIYIRPFEEAIAKADLGGAMCSFNKVNGESACENKTILTDLLKKEMQFKGFVMSDYGANLSTVESANSGLDLETPGTPYGKWGDQLLDAVKTGKVSEQTIDDKAKRILVQMFSKGLFDHPAQNNQIDARDHGKTARQLAEESMVLLQNKNNVLPLSQDKLKSIAVIGPDADNGTVAGGGSSLVNPTYTVSPLEGIRNRVGKGVTVQYAPGTDPISAGDIMPGPSAVPSSLLTTSDQKENISVGYATYGDAEQGLRGEYWKNNKMEGNPILVRNDDQVNMNLGFYNYQGFNAKSPKVPNTPTTLNGLISARWTGAIAAPKDGDYALSLTSLGSSKLYIDDKLFVDNQGTKLETTKKNISFKAGEKHKIRIEYRADYPTNGRDSGGMVRLGWEPPADTTDKLIDNAVKLAKKSDVAIVVTRTYESEGYVERSDMELPNNQDRLIRAVAAANPKTIVVQMSGRAVQMDTWQDKVPAIVQAWFAGQEQGNAIARVLFGDVNPSGKLPVTFPVNEQSTPVSSPEKFPGVNGVGDYSDGIFVGYRGYEKAGIQPAFSFGHGLSYTTFGYSDLKVKQHASGKKSDRTSSVEVSLKLKNTGKKAGAEVVQVYSGKLPTNVETPSRQLAGWAKVELKPGQEKKVRIELDPKALSYWDEKSKAWVMPSGEVPIYVGSSSQDTRLTGSVTIPATFTEKAKK